MKLAVGRGGAGEGGEDFPGCPVVRILGFHCEGYRFNPWLRN